MANDKNQHSVEAGLAKLGNALGDNDLDMVQAVRFQRLEEGLEQGIIPKGGIAHQQLSRLYVNMANRIASNREEINPKYQVIDDPQDIFESAFTLKNPEPSMLPPTKPPLPPKNSGNGNGNFLAASPH